ncbi:MAG: hypothetical protein PHD15_03520 [Clostridia bacterium]|nr:hypothetical protein [Clostridia bacterium]MDD4386811.1 hypothetical protein [Clostridia bacterium]
MKSCNENINGFSFILHSTLVSFTIANNLDAAEQTILGIFLADVGANLLTIAAYNKYIENKCTGNTDVPDYPFKPPLF